MSAIKAGSGRKKVSSVWKYFNHNDAANRSTCLTCNAQLNGSNPTNLITHLKTHPDVYKTFDTEENVRKYSIRRKSVSSIVPISGSLIIDQVVAIAKNTTKPWPIG